MRLDVGHDGADLDGDPGQQRDLVGHVLAEHLGVDVEVPPAEAGAVVVRHLRPHRDPAPDRLDAHRAHRDGVAGVVAAGHVGARHDREQPEVVGDPLAQVGVEVDAQASRLDCLG